MNEYGITREQERKKTKPVASQHLSYEGKHFSIIF